MPSKMNTQKTIAEFVDKDYLSIENTKKEHDVQSGKS